MPRINEIIKLVISFLFGSGCVAFIFMGIGIATGIGIGFRLLIKKTKPQGKLKKFLTLTGASVVGFFIFAILHNIISGLSSQLFKKEVEEPFFFLLATIVCPIGLIVGLIGSIIQLVKNKVRANHMGRKGARP